MKRRFNLIDLFAGCGGLLDGFLQEGHFRALASVEWEEAPCLTLRKRLEDKWHYEAAEQEVVRFDIRRTDELLRGFDDAAYGKHVGLAKLVGRKKVDVIIGGPPCQAYSLAGRIRDPHGMKNDYRNFLFESYIKVLERFRPKFFIFENVVGMLSANPDGTPIPQLITSAFADAGYSITVDLRQAVYDVADFGVPQHRRRVILLGIRNDWFKGKVTYDLFGNEQGREKIFDAFYQKILPSFKRERRTVNEAIGDLPGFYPDGEKADENQGVSHRSAGDSCEMPNHVPRYHNLRDIQIFRLLADDIRSGRNEYVTAESLKDLYTAMTGKRSNVHKYYVLRPDEPSNTIPAHLYKDGMRHIHPDPEQARSITVREAARLQSFDDDFIFEGSMGAQYKMIGNAVPPGFAKIIAEALIKFIKTYDV